jgi:hypothetical protein
LQWNVQDPVTDILAMRALFPAVIAAAELLGVDAELVTELHSATAKIPPLPRTDTATHSQLLGASADAAGQNAIAVSYQPTAPLNNQENLDLEAVWPYALIGDASADTELARRTYTYRRFTNTPDWSLDPVHAARLGLASEVARDLVAITQKYQAYPSGMASWQSPPSSNSREPYLEQAATATLAINEALVQSNDDLLKIAPAWPAAWNGAGAVHIRGGTRVTVVIENASVVAAVLEAGSTRSQRVRNPWVGSGATVLDGTTGELLVANDTATEMSVQLTKGHWYVIRRGDTAMMSVQRMITGTPAVSAKRLGSQSIGL